MTKFFKIFVCTLLIFSLTGCYCYDESKEDVMESVIYQLDEHGRIDEHGEYHDPRSDGVYIKLPYQLMENIIDAYSYDWEHFNAEELGAIVEWWNNHSERFSDEEWSMVVRTFELIEQMNLKFVQVYESIPVYYR